MAEIIEHNRLDLVSLAGLSARLLHLLKSGPSATSDAREAFALGRVYARAGLESRAIDAYDRAAALSAPRAAQSEGGLMRFKIDENLPDESADVLAQAGHDAVTVGAQRLR